MGRGFLKTVWTPVGPEIYVEGICAGMAFTSANSGVSHCDANYNTLLSAAKYDSMNPTTTVMFLNNGADNKSGLSGQVMEIKVIGNNVSSAGASFQILNWYRDTASTTCVKVV
jgi:hypothetical protein